MNFNFFDKSLMKHFKYAATVIVLFLSIISISANGYVHPHDKTNEGVEFYKKQSQPRMFLIAVIDSDDKDIGERCETDLGNVTYAFQDLADWLDVDMEDPKVIKGGEFSKAAVNDAIDNWLKSQQPASDDIVVFYYSGHGFRYPNDASDYPRMWLKASTDQNVETNNLRLEEDIYDRIIKLGAGVNIVLSDCCNTTAAGDNANFDNVTVPARERVAHKRQHPRNESSDDDEDYGDRLFIPDHPLSILATAAGKSEFAGGKADVGGFFTGYFLEALSKCIYDNKIQPAWENIFNYADENASYWARSAACPDAKHNEQGRCVQTVKFKIKSSD